MALRMALVQYPIRHDTELFPSHLCGRGLKINRQLPVGKSMGDWVVYFVAEAITSRFLSSVLLNCISRFARRRALLAVSV